MRRLILLAILTAITLPAGAAKRVTVAQLEQALTAASAAGKPDAEIARQIGGMELSERLTEATLDRLSAQVASGSQAALALQLLADQSAFLDPPGTELPVAAPPDAAGQQRILEAAQNYVVQTLPRLPNFLATRTINRYDDSPQELKKGAWPVRAGLHRVDTSSREISVRDERENQPPTQGSAVWQRQIGLISGGEFGTTLGMILADSAQGKVTWSHWEQTAAGLAAVFQYSVPKSASHFEIISSLQRQAAIEGLATPTGGSRGISGIGVRPNNNPARISMTTTKPGYRGALWLDPVTGTVLRITMEADSKDSSPYRRAAILVQYGPVQIGASQFICPVRSLALSEATASALAITGDAPTQWLNETVFTGYHRFAATTRILTDAATPETASPPDGNSGAK
jgi:hypothetical protein